MYSLTRKYARKVSNKVRSPHDKNRKILSLIIGHVSAPSCKPIDSHLTIQLIRSINSSRHCATTRTRTRTQPRGARYSKIPESALENGPERVSPWNRGLANAHCRGEAAALSLSALALSRAHISHSSLLRPSIAL